MAIYSMFVVVILAWASLFLPKWVWLGLSIASIYLWFLLLIGHFHVLLIPVALSLAVAWLYWFVTKRRTTARKWVNRLLVFASLFFLLLGGLLAYGLPVTRFAQPSGPYWVGTTQWLVSETLPVQAWYPTEIEMQRASYLLEGRPLITGLAQTLGLPALALQHWRLIKTPAYLDAPILRKTNAYPVVLFTHGLGGFKAQNTDLLLELASHGYVVIAVDQPSYAAATVIGQELIYNQHSELVGAFVSELDQHIPFWVDNMEMVLDELPQIQTRFNGSLDLARIGMLGHSFGGSTAYQVLQIDQRVLAAVNMDGGFFGEVNQISKPFLLINAENTLDVAAFRNQVNSLENDEFQLLTGQTKEAVLSNFDTLLERRHQALGENANALIISEIQHISFTDLPQLSPLFRSSVNPQPILKEAILVFFNQTLRDDTASLSDVVGLYANIARLQDNDRR